MTWYKPWPPYMYCSLYESFTFSSCTKLMNKLVSIDSSGNIRYKGGLASRSKGGGGRGKWLTYLSASRDEFERQSSRKYRIAGYFRTVQIFVFCVCKPCIRKLNVRKIEDCTTCDVRMRERTKKKTYEFFQKLVCTKICTYENILLYGIRIGCHTPLDVSKQEATPM